MAEASLDGKDRQPRRERLRARLIPAAFGRRLREAGLLASRGSVGDALDNAVAESFFASMQTELLDRRRIWDSRTQLANAMFEWIEVFYNRQRRHSTLGYKTPVDYDRTRPTAPAVAA